MAKPTDTFIPSNTNGNFRDDNSGAAKSYKVSITKPTKYPGEETTNAIIWLMDLDAYSSINPERARDLAGRDFDSDPTGNTTYPTKGNHYIFCSVFSFPDKNPKDGSELYDPWNEIETRDGVKSIRIDLGSSFQRVKYGELNVNNTTDDRISLALDYIKNYYINIIYARKKSTIWLDALKKYDTKEISDSELNKVYKDIGNLEENKVSFFIGDDVPTEIVSATQSGPEIIPGTTATASATSSTTEPREYTFDVQIENTFYNSEIGYLTITGKIDDTFVYGDEQDTIDPEYTEDEFLGSEEETLQLSQAAETYQNLQGEIPADTEPSTLNVSESSIDYNDPSFKGADWKNFDINTAVRKIQNTEYKAGKFVESLKKVLYLIKNDSQINDLREAAYLLGTAYAESSYSLQRWEADYACTGQGVPYGSSGPCSKATNYYRLTKGKKDYYTLGLDSKGQCFFGRGLIQLTGKANYETYGRLIGVNLVSNGDLALDPINSFKVASVYMRGRTFKYVLSNNLEKARRSVNGGTKGINEVNGAYNEWIKVIKDSKAGAIA